MARKLKVFTTSAGFFDLAVAAPSMKAALDAWGAGANLFHQGFAQQATAPAIVKAAMAQPGVVLRRPVGTDQPFREEAEASQAPFEGRVATKHRTRKSKAAAPERKPAADKRPGRREERARRQGLERDEAAARRKDAARQERAIAAATTALDKAEARHQGTMAGIEQARAALDVKADREADRWRRERERLEAALQEARGPTRRQAI